jgi:uncharacterized coiled-coil DUF342 family protein
MDVKNAYKEKMAAQMNEWAAQIGLLEAKIENANASIKLKGKEEIKSLHEKHDALVEKMNELRQSSGDAWAQIKLTTDNIWGELKSGIASVQAKFK